MRHRTDTRPVRRVLVALSAGVLLLAGCGSDDGDTDADAAAETADDTDGEPTETEPTESAQEATAAEPTEADPTEEVPDDSEQGEDDGAAAPSGETLSWFPSDAGATWTYAQEVQGETIEQTQTLAAVEPGDGGTVITIRNEFDNGTPAVELDYTVQPDGTIAVPFQSFNAGGAAGTVQASGDLVWLSPDQFAAGERQDGELTLDIDVAGQMVTADVGYTATPLGVETVTVPAGEYEASHMRIDMSIAAQGISQDVGLDIWFVEGIGYVKQSVDLLGQALDVQMVDFTPAG